VKDLHGKLLLTETLILTRRYTKRYYDYAMQWIQCEMSRQKPSKFFRIKVNVTIIQSKRRDVVGEIKIRKDRIYKAVKKMKWIVLFSLLEPACDFIYCIMHWNNNANNPGVFLLKSFFLNFLYEPFSLY
jgi:hypothetical protein